MVATIRRHAPIHLIFLISLLGYFLFRHLLLPSSGSPASGLAQSLWPRLLRVPVILIGDLSLLIFPKSLSIHRSTSIPRPHSLFEVDVLGSTFLIALLALALARLARHTDAPLWGMGWFLLIESSVLNLVPIYRVAAERFLYLPSIGFLVAVVFGVGKLAERLELSRPQVRWGRYAACLCGATVLLYSLRVVVRNRDWRDDVSLFQATVAASPTSLQAHINLGVAYMNSGQLALAEPVFLRALEMNPRSPTAHFGLGTIYLQQGKLSQGIAELQTAAEIAPSRAETFHNLGIGYLKLGRADQAVIELQRAVALDPARAASHYTLGLAYRQAGKPDLAASAFQRALSLDPTSGAARPVLGPR